MRSSLLSVFFVSIISVPLVISFQNMQKIDVIRQLVANENYLIMGEEVKLRRVKVHLGEPVIITADLLARGMPSAIIINDLERQLVAKLQQPLHYDFSIHLVDEVFSDQ